MAKNKFFSLYGISIKNNFRGSLMNNILKLFLFLALIFSKVYADSSVLEKIHKLNWNGMEVVWLEDDRFPTFSASIYFADGALSDSSSLLGETEAMFSLLSAGTNRYGQKEIADNLEFFWANYGGQVLHEYSTYSFSGLVKDLAPISLKICHLFKDATFPREEVNKYKIQIKSNLKTLFNSPSEMASRAYREILYKDSPFQMPTSGKLSTVKNFSTKSLAKKLNYFNTQVKKRIYLRGPSEVLGLEKIFRSSCEWDASKANFTRSVSKFKNPRKSDNKRPQIHLITVPKANQAQIKMGRPFFQEDLERLSIEKTSLSSQLLSGGFSSLLLQEVRVKRGLSYSINSYSGKQKEYGSSTVATFTKDTTVGEILNVIKDTLDIKEISDERFEMAVNGLLGSYPFKFEKSDDFLEEILNLDHLGLPYSELTEFNSKVKKLNKNDLIEDLNFVFNYNQFSIVILGEKKLAKVLKDFGDLKVYSYKDFL